MGRWTLTALVINSIIGSGIFGLPSLVAGLLGKQSPLAYLLGAAGMGLVIACFAEVASQFRRAGGPYLYAREAFGRVVGVEVGLFLLIVKLTVAAAAADLFTDYLVEFWPAMHAPLPRAAMLTALLGFVAAVNVRGVKSGAATNNVFTVAKLAPLIVFAIAGVFFVLRGHTPHPETVQAAATALPARNWFNAVLIVTYALGGFEGAVVPMSEARDPQRDAPFALFVSLGTVTLLYSAIQYVVVSVLPNAAASERPLAAAARQLWGGPGASLMTVGALLSVYGYLTAMMLHSPRVLFALGENGDLPRFFARIHERYRTPYVSILTFVFIAWCLATLGTFKWNVLLSSAGRLVVFGFTCAALPALRRRNPAGGYRLPAGNQIALAGVLFAAVLAWNMARIEIATIVAAVAIAISSRLWTRSEPLRAARPDHP